METVLSWTCSNSNKDVKAPSGRRAMRRKVPPTWTQQSLAPEEMVVPSECDASETKRPKSHPAAATNHAYEEVNQPFVIYGPYVLTGIGPVATSTPTKLDTDSRIGCRLHHTLQTLQGNFSHDPFQ